jgi:hypothetical protein
MITLKVNTKGYGGKHLNKNADVYTNESNPSLHTLAITGQVDNFVTISPNYVRLQGFEGEPIKESVRIIPEEKYPFKVLNVKAQNGENIGFQLQEVKESNTTQYLLTVENRKNDQGRYVDSIILETDSSIRPELDVRVFGYVRARPQKQTP